MALFRWSPERLQSWAAKIGPNTATLVALILRDRSHLLPGRGMPAFTERAEQGFRSCLGIMRLDQLRTLRLDGMAEAFVELQTQDGEPCRAIDGVDGPTSGIALCQGGSVKART